MSNKLTIATVLSLVLALVLPNTAGALTLGAFCNSPKTKEAVLSFAGKMKFPEARGAKPDVARFDEASGSVLKPPMICVFRLTYKNTYDFGDFSALVEEVKPGVLKVKSLKAIE